MSRLFKKAIPYNSRAAEKHTLLPCFAMTATGGKERDMGGIVINDLFGAFDSGRYVVPEGIRDFSALPWNAHPKFRGVALKHLVVGADSGGLFSYHLVRIEPGEAIGAHIHDPQTETHEVVAGDGVCVNGDLRFDYSPGTLSLFQPRVEHSVRAGESGLLLFAKFYPPLC
jgi:quercetin dioxygenase-like cupin family protein